MQGTEIAADFVVIGAGSAGCVVAARLAEAGASVVLAEAGPSDWYPWIHVPAAILKLLYNPRVNWNYFAEPDPGAAGRALHWPRGRVLGGSSSINGMLYVRGNPADFDGWAQMGCRGWSFADVLPFFRKAETYRQKGEPAFRGQDGPLQVEDYRTILDLTHRFVEAAQQAGHAFLPDMNGSRSEGVGYSQMTRRGRLRGSTAATYLRRVRQLPNLRVLTGATATGLRFAGRRCTGVAVRHQGRDLLLKAGREVVLSGGAVNSPHLLQLSGIGPAAHLQSLGIEVRHDAPGVGANLSDHYTVRVAHRIRDLISINQLSRPPRVLAEAMKFLLTGKGALTFGVTASSVFCRSRDGLSSPDLQLLFTPASYIAGKFVEFERESGLSVAICPTRPDSRGTILAKSADPLAAPVIRANYLSAESDVRVMLAGIARARHILAQPAIAKHSGGELVPGPAVQSEADLTAFIRERGVTLYHPVGTCRMGEDPGAVVDSRLKVRGIGGLRVIDASVMPTLTTGNTNAPTIMIGEKGAAMMLEDLGQGTLAQGGAP